MRLEHPGFRPRQRAEHVRSRLVGELVVVRHIYPYGARTIRDGDARRLKPSRYRRKG
jgi:hypothetical protein